MAAIGEKGRTRGEEAKQKLRLECVSATSEVWKGSTSSGLALTIMQQIAGVSHEALFPHPGEM